MALLVVAEAVLVEVAAAAAEVLPVEVVDPVTRNHFHHLDMALALLDSDALCPGLGFRSG